MSDTPPVLDFDAEATHIAVQAVPGAVFLRMRRERGDATARRMFIELTVAESLALRRELDQAIEAAAAADTL